MSRDQTETWLWIESTSAAAAMSAAASAANTAAQAFALSMQRRMVSAEQAKAPPVADHQPFGVSILEDEEVGPQLRARVTAEPYPLVHNDYPPQGAAHVDIEGSSSEEAEHVDTVRLSPRLGDLSLLTDDRHHYCFRRDYADCR
jgi:hypothetical protein